MYPTISDLIKDLFGLNIPMPIQSFGFFVAVSFIVAAWLVLLELKRKEKLGIISVQQKSVVVGKPASFQELFLMGLVGFILGFKLIGIIMNYSSFADNPQQFVFSSDGSLLGGILFAAGAVYMRYREKQKAKLDKPKTELIDVHPYELTGNIIMLGALFGIIGAKIFHNLENIDEFIADPLGALVSFSGLTFYGGLIFAAISIIWYARKNKIPALVISDVAAPAIMIAYAIGRIGCQVAGDGDWGIINEAVKPGWLSFLPDWMWAFNFPHNVINEGVAIPGCVGKHCFMLDPPVFPTPFYETVMCTILFFILWGFRRRIKITGVLFSIFLMMNGVERFFIEKIRVNTKYHIFGHPITQAEIISTLLFITGVVMLIYLLRNHKKKRKLIEPNPTS
jgi:phosphatidylglycerol---prolipoprotein diacylglyceryl transferase